MTTYRSPGRRRWQNGDIIDGRFMTTGWLGRGATSSVYLAEDLHSGAAVALKLQDEPLPGMAITPAQQRALFRHEARMLRQAGRATVAPLRRPPVARLHHAQLEREPHYLAVEYLPGPSLERLLEDRLTLAQALLLADGVAATVAALHAIAPAVLHLDIKPANLLLDADGTIVLIDLGAARLLGLAPPGDVPLLGSLPYAPPEQRAGGALDRRADQHALAVVIADLLGAAAPPQVQAVLARASADQPRDRYRSVAAFREALWRAGQAARARRPRRSARRQPLLLAATLAALGLLLCGLQLAL